MPQSVYKGYELQATGSNTDTWGEVLNDDVYQIIDNNLGAVTAKALSSSNVTLSASESQSAILRLTGTLTANVVVTTSCQGFFFVENLTTGSFTVTVTNGVAGVVAPQSARMTMIASTANGVRIASDTFASGTAMVFHQAAAPTGWTKAAGAAYNDAALRVTTGTGGGTGGSTVFTSVFAARSIAQANLPNVNFTGTAASSGSEHTHTIAYGTRTVDSPSAVTVVEGIGTGASTATTNSTGAHTHTVSVASGGSGTAMDFAVKYIDVIVATKD
jgi:hypothetical protein